MSLLASVVRVVAAVAAPRPLEIGAPVLTHATALWQAAALPPLRAALTSDLLWLDKLGPRGARAGLHVDYAPSLLRAAVVRLRSAPAARLVIWESGRVLAAGRCADEAAAVLARTP